MLTRDGVKMEKYSWYKVAVRMSDNKIVLNEIGIYLASMGDRILLYFPKCKSKLHSHTPKSFQCDEGMALRGYRCWFVDVESLESIRM